MNKIKVLTSLVAITAATPSFADIAVNAVNPSCTEPTIGATIDGANLQAEWNANTIYLEWYDGDTKITPVNSSANACTYDDEIVVPTNTMTKEGYTFTGWRVRRAAAAPAQCSLSSLDATIPVPYFASKGISGEYCEGWDANQAQDDGYFGVGEGGSCSDSEFSGLSTGEWEIRASYGTVKGEARCSTTPGEWLETGNPVAGGGQYCWCKATSYTPTNGSQCNVASSSWVFFIVRGTADDCANLCADFCVDGVQSFDDFRSAVFGQSN